MTATSGWTPLGCPTSDVAAWATVGGGGVRAAEPPGVAARAGLAHVTGRRRAVAAPAAAVAGAAAPVAWRPLRLRFFLCVFFFFSIHRLRAALRSRLPRPHRRRGGPKRGGPRQPLASRGGLRPTRRRRPPPRVAHHRRRWPCRSARCAAASIAAATPAPIVRCRVAAPIGSSSPPAACECPYATALAASRRRRLVFPSGGRAAPPTPPTARRPRAAPRRRDGGRDRRAGTRLLCRRGTRPPPPIPPPRPLPAPSLRSPRSRRCRRGGRASRAGGAPVHP